MAPSPGTRRPWWSSRRGPGGETGLGWTYADRSCVDLIGGVLPPVVVGHPVADVPANWLAMRHRVRNLGRPGLVSCALSAVDTSLWDLAARIAGMLLARLLGRVHEDAALYASGGFTTYDDAEFDSQLEEGPHVRGVLRVKIKIGGVVGNHGRARPCRRPPDQGARR